MTVAEANTRLTAPGQMFEIEEIEIRGINMVGICEAQTALPKPPPAILQTRKSPPIKGRPPLRRFMRPLDSQVMEDESCERQDGHRQPPRGEEAQMKGAPGKPQRAGRKAQAGISELRAATSEGMHLPLACPEPLGVRGRGRDHPKGSSGVAADRLRGVGQPGPAHEPCNGS